jgi:hypothetical protein
VDIVRRPKLQFTVEKFVGEGGTNIVGDIRIGRLGSGPKAVEAIRETVYHEKGHQFFTPKLQVLREVRIYIAQSSYRRSYILRYLEEAVVETVRKCGSTG